MAFNRLTAMAQALAAAALKDGQSLDGKSERWVARNVADKILHQDRFYQVHEADHRPKKDPHETGFNDA